MSKIKVSVAVNGQVHKLKLKLHRKSEVIDVCVGKKVLFSMLQAAGRFIAYTAWSPQTTSHPSPAKTFQLACELWVGDAA